MTIEDYCEIVCKKTLMQPQKAVLEKLEEMKNGAYNQALDDFAQLCKKHKSKDEYQIMCFDEYTVNKFVEQLKK